MHIPTRTVRLTRSLLFLHVRLVWFPGHMDWERRKQFGTFAEQDLISQPCWEISLIWEWPAAVRMRDKLDLGVASGQGYVWTAQQSASRKNSGCRLETSRVEMLRLAETTMQWRGFALYFTVVVTSESFCKGRQAFKHLV